jgi:hypothetical protein
VLADGTLDFAAAARTAKTVVISMRKNAAAMAAGPMLTFRTAVQHYIAERDARDTRRAGRVLNSDARGAIAAAPIAERALHQLSETDLTDRLRALPGNLKQTARQRL